MSNLRQLAMRGRKYSITLGIALVCVMLFTACDNTIEPPEIDTTVSGYGRISISFAIEEVAEQTARTVLPSTVFDKYVYTFTKAGETTGVVKAPDNSGFFILEVGSYTVEVQAYVGNAEPYTLAANGVSSVFSVSSGNNVPVEVVLTAVGTEAQGKFSYTITYPADATAEITLQKWPEMYDITLNPVNVSQGNGKTQTLQLGNGFYLLSVLVSKTGLYAGISEMVHIYPSLSTVYTKNYVDIDFLQKLPGAAVSAAPTLNDLTQNSITINPVFSLSNGQSVEYGINTSNTTPSTWQTGLTFTGLSGGVYYLFARSVENDDFAAGAASASLPVMVVTTSQSWSTVLAAIRDGGDGTYVNPKTYTVTVFGNVSVPGTTTASFDSVQYIAVTLRGSGTLSLSGSGSILRLGSNQTLIIDDENMTLQGRSGNSNAIVYVLNYGVLELKNGNISGNTGSANGGGVCVVTSGIFKMSGGKISNNTGGGVYIATSGTFKMGGGEISNNTDGGVSVGASGNFEMNSGEISNNTGGGVYMNTTPINNRPTFVMNGGEISNNTGGGVNMSRCSNFTMNSGKISDNSASQGGGVYIYESTFIMKGGEISDNTASSSSSPYYGYGGGVYVATDGTFTMSGGKISGNTALSSSYPKGYGGGVRIAGGTFTMSGGTISNNTVNGSGGGGGGVDNANGSFTITGGIVYGNDADSMLANTASIGAALYLGGLDGNGGTATAKYGNGTNILPYTDGQSLYTNNTITGSAVLYTITFDANGGSGTIPDSQTVNVGSSITLPSGSGLSKEFFNFGGWNTNSYGTGTNYDAGTIYAVTDNITLYAKWNYCVTFDANGGSGTAPAAQTVNPGSSITLPSGSGLLKDFFSSFGGWNTNSSGTGTNYDAGAVYEPTGNITLYAKWNTVTGLANKLAFLQTNAQSGGSYILEVSANEGIAPHTLSYSNRSNITITLTGDGTNRTISLSSNGAMFTVNSGVTLILDDNITLQGRSNNNGSLVKVNSSGTLVMNVGSIITGNTSFAANTTYSNSCGSGVYVDTNGTFTMNGGEISGNTSTTTTVYSSSYGGGVYVGNSGIFTMNGGKISSNTVSGSGTTSSSTTNVANGGGVYVDANGTFTMNDGEISNNTASGNNSSNRQRDANGGGVYVDTNGTFTMSGGEISSNTAANGGYGGGVGVGWESHGTGIFTMSGGEISGNTADMVGGGVYVRNGTFTMTGGEISDNTTPYHDGGGVNVALGGIFTMEGGTISNNTAWFYGGGVTVSYGTFIMNGTAKISGNTALLGGGVGVSSGTFTMNGGSISGNTASESSSSSGSRGGGVDVSASGTFTKTGGTIYGYSASDPVNSNTVKNSFGTVLSNLGHTVYAYSSSVTKRKETTAGPGVNLSFNGSTGAFSGGWDY